MIILTLDRTKAASFRGKLCRRIIFQPDTFSNNLYNIKVELLVSNKRQEGCAGAQWDSHISSNYKQWHCKPQIGKWKKLPFACENSICMNMEMQTWGAGLCDYATRWMLINSDRVVYNQSGGFFGPQGQAQPSHISRWAEPLGMGEECYVINLTVKHIWHLSHVRPIWMFGVLLSVIS